MGSARSADLGRPRLHAAEHAPMAIGQKLSRTLSTPAVSVVIDTKASGAAVTHTYRTLPMLMMMVVTTASASAASC